MAKAFFLNIPAHGHMNPSLPLVQELVQRGEEITYFTGEEFREKLAATGATFRTYEGLGEGVRFRFKDYEKQSPNLVMMARIMIQFTEDVLPPLLDVLRQEQPNYIRTILPASGDCWLPRYWHPAIAIIPTPSTSKPGPILIPGCGAICSPISQPGSHT
jgi:UDP:flavonoid glycosyltransferase YjiC (YdhE family)